VIAVITSVVVQNAFVVATITAAEVAAVFIYGDVVTLKEKP
jgi:hypothetical protein